VLNISLLLRTSVREIGRLGGHGFRGTVTAGDGSNQKGRNGNRVCKSEQEEEERKR